MKVFPLTAFIQMIGVLTVLAGCTPVRKELPRGEFVRTCIQGTVWYRLPSSAAPSRYAGAKITAWRHGTDTPLAEAEADLNGNYCMEIPVGFGTVDLRVWGYKHVEEKDILCRGSRDDVSIEHPPGKCGEDCMEVNLTIDCTDRIPRRRPAARP
jgi:hypothetical protein